MRLDIDEVSELATLPYLDVRGALAAFPRWTHYVLGVAVVCAAAGLVRFRQRDLAV